VGLRAAGLRAPAAGRFAGGRFRDAVDPEPERPRADDRPEGRVVVVRAGMCRR
jgi:hypothetical protein